MRKNVIKKIINIVLVVAIGLLNPISGNNVYAKEYQINNRTTGSHQITEQYAYNKDLPDYVVGKWITNPGNHIFDTEEEADAYAVAVRNKQIIPDVGEVATQLDYDRGLLKSNKQIGTYKSYLDEIDKKFVTFATYDEAIVAYERRNYVKDQSKLIKAQLAGLFGFTYSGNPTYMDNSEYLDPENVTYDVSLGWSTTLIDLTYQDSGHGNATFVYINDANNKYNDFKEFKDSFGDTEYENVTVEEINNSEAGKSFYVQAEIVDNWHAGGWYTDGDSHVEIVGPFSTITEAMQTALVIDYTEQYTSDHILHGYYYQEYGDDILVNIIYELYCLGYDITQLPGYIG